MNKVIEMMIVNDLNNDVHKEIVVILSPFMTVLWDQRELYLLCSIVSSESITLWALKVEMDVNNDPLRTDTSLASWHRTVFSICSQKHCSQLSELV